MQGIPLYSTLTLFTEIIITVSILWVFYRGYYKNHFPFRFTAAVLAYEILFNISYMASRFLPHSARPQQVESPFHTMIAIFHGTFALLMFILLLIFMGFAWRGYRKGTNFFKVHTRLTVTFLVAWMIAIISGFVFYYAMYLGPGESQEQSVQSVGR